MKKKKLQQKLQELLALAERDRIDIREEISRLREKITGDDDPAGRAWAKVLKAREPDRPTALDLIENMADSFLELHGDRAGGDDPALVGGIGLFNGEPVTFLGHQKGRNLKGNILRNYGMAHPEGYRKAHRLARQAEKFGRPVITLIDTPGAYPGIASERRGIAEAIAANLKLFSSLKVPVLTVIFGEGGSGGALGIGVGDRIFMLENAVYSVISPEGCASILLKNSDQAPAAAGLLKLTADDLLGFGIIDGIIPEPDGGAARDHPAAAAVIKEVLLRELAELRLLSPAQLIKNRSRRLAQIGSFSEPNGFLMEAAPGKWWNRLRETIVSRLPAITSPYGEQGEKETGREE
ncbi:MAG: acetyl-CoA carboxylase carboxyltransferase subunit alpha [Candidatus Erginobacter occultus]|nr:acetyl-CoA carboxylase carboxyltransferase subunit alpha [Candidatus Erginobacter occultus]